MTMAATQDRACSTSLMNKADEAIKRLATSASGTKRTCLSVRDMSVVEAETETCGADYR
jgi:hypothetical protein